MIFKNNLKINRGFSLIEIILAMAVAVIVFVAVFYFITSVYIQKKFEDFSPDSYFSYRYGEAYCDYAHDTDLISLGEKDISLIDYISTSTRITSIHSIANTLNQYTLLMTTDSSSTTEDDIFMFNINTDTGFVSKLGSMDTGPGIQDSKLLNKYLYIANTSVNSHIKSIYIDVTATGTAMFKELSNTKIITLAQNSSLPKKLTLYDKKLILGSEKSASGGELFVFPIENNGEIGTMSQMLEIGGQVNQSLYDHHRIYVANAADPELRVFDSNFQQYLTYDAPLTLGNGKSVLFISPYVIFGRTLGSGELSLLKIKSSSSSVEVLNTTRTNGTVDFLQDIGNQRFISITSYQNKGLQFWHIMETPLGGKIVYDKGIDIPDRVTSYTCAEKKMFITLLINNKPTLIWLNF